MITQKLSLKKWIKQIKELRRLVDKPVKINIIEDDALTSSIHLIKIKENCHEHTPYLLNPSLRELCKFCS